MSRVVSLSDHRGSREPGRDAELKRLALQLAVQLPKDQGEAIDTVEHLRALVRGFLGDSRPS